ncbi:unnamed protein product, partial [Effrenium voratum]
PVPSSKRRRVEEPIEAAPPEKTALVDKVKTLQRTSPELKEAWWMFCDTQSAGMKDPGRHSVESLEQFLATHGQ